MKQAIIIAAALTATATLSHAQEKNFRADTEAHHSKEGASIRSIVEGLGPGWIIKSETIAENPETGQRFLITGSASSRGTQTRVEETTDPWLRCPVYVYENGRVVRDQYGRYAVARYQRRRVPQGTSFWYEQNGGAIAFWDKDGPGAVFASANNEAGMIATPAPAPPPAPTVGAGTIEQRRWRPGSILFEW